jgi:hypothetical protein
VRNLPVARAQDQAALGAVPGLRIAGGVRMNDEERARMLEEIRVEIERLARKLATPDPALEDLFKRHGVGGYPAPRAWWQFWRPKAWLMGLEPVECGSTDEP